MTQDELKMVLEALAQAHDESLDENHFECRRILMEQITAIKEALAQPEREPVAVQLPFSVQQAYAMAQVCLDLHEALGCKWGDNPYLVIAALLEAQPEQPAQRTWVELTDEEIDKTHEIQVWDARRSYARAIEAKLKEKNT